MSTGTQTCDIVLPGYVLTERIGSGGYAEVWRAEAPGGIEKAVKIVYGFYDDELASQELKALERIKGVRHPFLLSLERFEVLNGRLAILTELADMSLEQRLRQCRAEGLPGIPRAELLRYMADAAEALDFLSQRHNLLHLDIKPENLLVSGDHIKVADFGLVKELASRTQNSLVSGMTPTYASPEMFDDEPTAYSDQYSLAIVYQEMLVGALPFPGRTAAQLAKQHTQAEPQLTSLPAEDRPIVARALAKQATDRYPSCCAFVEALLHRGEAVPAVKPSEIPRPVPVIPRPSTPQPDDTKPPSVCTTIRRPPGQTPAQAGVTVTQPVERAARASQLPPAEVAAAPIRFVPEDTVDIGVPEANAETHGEQATLYVATGGVGTQVLCRLRALAARNDESDEAKRAFETIALDTDRAELQEACSARWKSPLSPDDKLHLPLRLPKSYEDAREILGWVSRRWLYNIPRSLETRGYRPLGRVALVDHSRRVLELIDRKLERLATWAGGTGAAGEALDAPIKIVLLTGTGGGTGAGMAIDIANATRSLAAARKLQVEVHGYFVCTCLGNNNSSPLLAANTYSLLTELNHATSFGNENTGDQAVPTQMFDSRESPFDCVYWVPARARTADVQTMDTIDAVAEYLAWERTPDARTVLRACRASQTPREQLQGRSLSLRKFGIASLADQKSTFLSELAIELACAIKRHWVSQDTSANWKRLVGDELRAASVPRLEAATGDSDSPPAVVPVNDATPLALRGRFKEHMSLEFTSEVLRQIQRQFESRDERGRPLIQARDAKLIADMARTVVASFAESVKNQSSSGNRFADSKVLRPLAAAGSRRVLRHAMDRFDAKQPERFLQADTLDELIHSECRVLLEESIADPKVAGAITSLFDSDTLAAAALKCATTDLLQCGCDRRTLYLVPKEGQANSAVVEKLRALRPLAAVITADVDDVLVVSEEAGIAPRSVALGLDRVFPGIADAANRLLTRVDVDWQSLV